MYKTAITSNLPIIILTLSTSFETKSKFIAVMPLMSPVVVNAETDSNSESRYDACVIDCKTYCNEGSHNIKCYYYRNFLNYLLVSYQELACPP